MAIRSFRHKGLKRLYERGERRDVPASLIQRLTDVLLAIDEAQRPQEVGLFPGWRLHPLKGDLKGFWSVSVSGNWRVIFRFEKGDAFDVDLVDYH
jgi:toxin HigB-1